MCTAGIILRSPRGQSRCTIAHSVGAQLGRSGLQFAAAAKHSSACAGCSHWISAAIIRTIRVSHLRCCPSMACAPARHTHWRCSRSLSAAARCACAHPSAHADGACRRRMPTHNPALAAGRRNGGRARAARRVRPDHGARGVSARAVPDEGPAARRTPTRLLALIGIPRGAVSPAPPGRWYAARDGTGTKGSAVGTDRVRLRRAHGFERARRCTPSRCRGSARRAHTDASAVIRAARHMRGGSYRVCRSAVGRL